MSENIKIKITTKPKRKLIETNALEDNTDVNEPENKRIKLSEEKDTEITNNDTTSTETDFTSDLSAFSDLPNEILYHHVAVLIPIEWLYVSKYLHNIAMQNLERDPRIKWDKQSFERALKVDNVTAIIKHLSMTKFDDDFLREQFICAARFGCIRVTQYLLDHESILKLDPSKPSHIYTYACTLIDVVSNGHKDIVLLLIQSGRYRDDLKNKNMYLQAALSKNDKSIATILIENGFYMNMLEVTLKFITPGCDIEILQMLLKYVDSLNYKTIERVMILERAIYKSANHVVEFLLGFFKSIPEFEEKYIITAVFNKNVAMVNALLLDKRFKVTQLSVEKATSLDVNSRKILRRLVAEERVRKLIDFRHLMRLVAESGTKKIFKALLDDENIDLTRWLHPTLITTAFLNPNPDDIILTLLDCPRINFHFYNSFALFTAIQFKCSSVIDAILNDPRFVVMDETHYHFSIDNATRNSQDNLLSELKKKNVAKLSPSEFWTADQNK